MSTKAQVWTTDFMISLLILVATLVIFARGITNITATGNEDLSPLIIEGRAISDQLMSEGYPTNWNLSNVANIGIVTNNRINDTKINAFYSMNYSDARKKFNTRYDFFVFVLDENNKPVNINGSYGIGHSLVNATQDSITLGNLDNAKLVKIARLTIHESKVRQAVVYIWD